jgi:hypothetical protein
MLRLAAGAWLVVLGVFAWTSSADAQAVAASTLVLGATFAPRSSLTVSASRLQFDVAEDGRVGEVVVAYRVAARTRRGGGVALIVEPSGSLEASGGVGTAGLTVTCGAEAGGPALFAGHAKTVGRWRESGVREGTIRCRLDGAAAPGHYVLPVRFAVVFD